MEGGAVSRKFEGLSTLLSRPAARRTLFILAPIGYAVALLLAPMYEPAARAQFRIGRAEALQRASAFLASRGFDTGGWSSNVRTGAADDVAAYLATLPTREAAVFSRTDPGVFVRASFWNARDNSLCQVWFSPEANVYRWTVTDTGQAGLTTAESDRSIAAATLERAYGNAAPPWTFERMSDDTSGNTHLRRFVWIRPAGSATTEAAISVRGGRVVGESLTTRPPQTKSAAAAALQRVKVLRMTVGISMAVIAAILLIWGAVRWLIRFREHEVSHGRAAVLAACVVLGTLPGGIMGMYAGQLDQGRAPERAMLIMSMALVLALFGGFAVLCGVAWAGGEGDLRRLFPRKLAAADALLSGRLLSRNVGRSVLAGIMVAGVGSAAMALAGAVGASAASIRYPITDNLAQLLGAAAPWLFIPSANLIGTIITTLAGIVIGIPLAARITHDRTRAVMLVAIPLALVSLAEIPGTGLMAIVAALAVGASSAATQLIAFTAGDLLASVAATVAIGLCRGAGFFLAQPNAEMRAGGASILALLAFAAAGAAIVAWRGREWPEQELLPAYARRMVLNEEVRAEMGLAREAQRKLLSRGADTIAGLAIATEVIPASTVGGDYVDTFARPDGRLLWIVAEGGGRGAGAALAMTLTRGLLLALARGRLDAAEVARRVDAHLRNELGEEGVPRFLIGTCTAGETAIAIARNGSSPKVAIRPASGSARSLPFQFADSLLQTANVPLAPGDGLMAWTDGVEALPDVWGARFGEERILETSDRSPRSAPAWRESLRSRFASHAGGLSRGHLADDLALLLIVREGRAAS
jgi:hypothetical protein